jgi:4-hydroxy-3-methylbut-2-enyl diphosphate reductase
VAHLVNDVSQVRSRWLRGIGTVGLTSGASAPDVLVDAVLGYLRSRGFDRVELVEPVQEQIVFALPAELRRH